tara:strand:+ start:7797 stop:8477 length:681 start_codon:yes stop_codon:yes gene_type:complete
MSYEVALFDLDSTLFDSALSEQLALKTSLEHYSVSLTDDVLSKYKVINTQLWLDFEQNDIELDKLRTERFTRLCQELNFAIQPGDLADLYEHNLGKSGKLYDGAAELLAQTKKTAKTGLITNGLESVQKARLEHFNLYQYFEVILISGECGLAKPDPAIFQSSLDLLGHKRKDSVLMIGDSLSSDIAGANNFGIDSCWYNPKRLKLHSSNSPTFTVYSLQEIASLV